MAKTEPAPATPQAGMAHCCLQVIRDEHAALAAVLRSLGMMVRQGPGDAPEAFFDVMRAMLFYIDEFPELQHHTKESDLLFPRVARLAPELMDAIVRLEQDHSGGEAAVRELQHLLLAWELMGDGRRAAFEQALARYQDFYLRHMQVEEREILPAAQRLLTVDDWKVLDAAFAANTDPLANPHAHDPAYDRLFTRIVMCAPAPIGVGAPLAG